MLSKAIIVLGILAGVARVFFAPQVFIGNNGNRLNAALQPDAAVTDVQVLALHLALIALVTFALWFLTKPKPQAAVVKADSE